LSEPAVRGCIEIDQELSHSLVHDCPAATAPNCQCADR